MTSITYIQAGSALSTEVYFCFMTQFKCFIIKCWGEFIIFLVSVFTKGSCHFLSSIGWERTSLLSWRFERYYNFTMKGLRSKRRNYACIFRQLYFYQYRQQSCYRHCRAHCTACAASYDSESVWTVMHSLRCLHCICRFHNVKLFFACPHTVLENIKEIYFINRIFLFCINYFCVRAWNICIARTFVF